MSDRELRRLIDRKGPSFPETDEIMSETHINSSMKFVSAIVGSDKHKTLRLGQFMGQLPADRQVTTTVTNFLFNVLRRNANKLLEEF